MTATEPVIGIIGGGQLARMMHEAAIRLGVRTRLLSASATDSAALVMADVTLGDPDDADAVVAFARGCDVITFDHEHVPPVILRRVLEAGVAVRPGPEALVHAQDKAVMRQRLSAFAPCPEWEIAADADDLVAFGERVGWPIIVKTARGGYDGKGVWTLADAAAARAWDHFGEVEIVVEECVDFARELSALVARSPSGQAVAYPVSESVQRDGICVETTTPAPGLADAAAEAAQQLALRIADELGVVGMLAVELMERRDGTVVVNELAMRPHNTGHWSIDGAVTSQFENHLRAVLDLPLGEPSATAPWVVMGNVLGGSEPELVNALLHVFARDRGAHAHLYGKAVTPRRKVGHVTCVGDDRDEVLRRARHAAAYLMGDRDG